MVLGLTNPFEAQDLVQAHIINRQKTRHTFVSFLANVLVVCLISPNFPFWVNIQVGCRTECPCWKWKTRQLEKLKVANEAGGVVRGLKDSGIRGN